MEEFTGAWCAWCPRGTAAMQMLSDLYPDRFVGIAIHRGDPMQIAGYDAFKPNYDSYPGAFINRNEDVVDPYNGLSGMPITDIVSYTLSQTCEADLAVNATWSEPAIVDIDVTTTFRFSTTQRNYALALVVLQDGLTGSGDDWAQKNNYSGNAEWKDLPYMQTFYELPGLITDYAYDHVAISTSGIERGITGSITSPIVSDEPQHFVTTIDLSDKRAAARPAARPHRSHAHLSSYRHRCQRSPRPRYRRRGQRRQQHQPQPASQCFLFP